MILNDAELAALDSGTFRQGVFFRLDTDPVVRLWLGFGDIDPGVSVYDPAGARYYGFGAIRDVPVFKQLINGKAARVDFTISGVSGDILRIASGGDAQQVKGKTVAIAWALMGDDWQLLGPLHPAATFTADYLGIDQAPSVDATASRSIRLSCGSLTTSRRRPSYSYFTDQDQQARSPGDRFCERTPVYANGFSKAWPTFPPP